MSTAEARRAEHGGKMLQLFELKTESAALEEQFNSFWRSL